MTVTDDAYSPYKALRHLDVLQAVRAGVPARPVHVQMILSDLCNQACHFCAYRDPHYTSSQLFRVEEPGHKGLRKPGLERWNFNPNRKIEYSKTLEILDDCAAMGVQAIQFTGGGEPTVHARFEDVLAETMVRQLRFSVVTNGVLVIKRQLADAMTGADWVRVSLDAGNAETYGKMRGVPPSHFLDAVAAIKTLAESKRSWPGTECIVGVGFVVNPENWREVHQAALIARDSGADNFRISAQFSPRDERLFDEWHAECAALCKKAEQLSSPTFTVYNRFGDRLEDLRQKRPDYALCGYQQFTTYIGADLNVYRCCGVAYNQRGLLGSLKDRRFRDLWMSQERADDMERFDARGCERCQFNGINRMLDYALRADEPAHAEFV